MDHIELTHFKQQGCHQHRERQLMRNWLRQRLEANDVPGKFMLSSVLMVKVIETVPSGCVPDKQKPGQGWSNGSSSLNGIKNESC